MRAENPGRFGTDVHRLTVEQGIEMGKPSRIQVDLSTNDGAIQDISVGGLATKLEDRSI